MGRLDRYLSLCLVTILLVSSLLMIIPTNAQTIPKPAVPEFTLRYVTNPYDVAPTTTTDPYTGKTVATNSGYHVENKSIEIQIKNQAFSPYWLDSKQQQWIVLYYNISYKGHYETDWQYFAYDRNTEWFFSQSNNEYTLIAFRDIPSEGTLDFRVQAQIGYYTEYHMPFDAYDFTGQVSGWSNTKSFTLPAIANTISPNPTVPEFPITATLIAILAAVSLLLIIGKKKLIT